MSHRHAMHLPVREPRTRHCGRRAAARIWHVLRRRRPPAALAAAMHSSPFMIVHICAATWQWHPRRAWLLHVRARCGAHTHRTAHTGRIWYLRRSFVYYIHISHVQSHYVPRKPFRRYHYQLPLDKAMRFSVYQVAVKTLLSTTSQHPDSWLQLYEASVYKPCVTGDSC